MYKIVPQPNFKLQIQLNKQKHLHYLTHSITKLKTNRHTYQFAKK
jgi:hypothetical protein